MITRLGMDFSSKLAVFSISSAADVTNLPTMSEYGKEDAAQCQPVAPGSKATLDDGSGTKYVLSSSTNTWVQEA